VLLLLLLLLLLRCRLCLSVWPVCMMFLPPSLSCLAQLDRPSFVRPSGAFVRDVFCARACAVRCN